MCPRARHWTTSCSRWLCCHCCARANGEALWSTLQRPFTLYFEANLKVRSSGGSKPEESCQNTASLHHRHHAALWCPLNMLNIMTASVTSCCRPFTQWSSFFKRALQSTRVMGFAPQWQRRHWHLRCHRDPGEDKAIYRSLSRLIFCLTQALSCRVESSPCQHLSALFFPWAYKSFCKGNQNTFPPFFWLLHGVDSGAHSPGSIL